MAKAIEGDSVAAKEFLRCFLTATLFVPERHQSVALAGVAKYPNDFVSVLGVSDNTTTFVPCFTCADYIEDWSGNKLQFKEVQASKLLELIPDGWWLVLNPSSEVEKEFSPWEIEQLKAGERNIAEVVAEIFSDDTQPISIGPIGSDDAPALSQALGQAFESEPGIESIYLLKEAGLTSTSEVKSTLVVGVILKNGDQSEITRMSEKITQLSATAQIGSDPARIFVATNSDQSVTLKMFIGFKPIYSRTLENKQGLFGRIAGLFGKS